MRNNILFSGGNQQKALFARALASDARIILLDDPTCGVDINKSTARNLCADPGEAKAGRTFSWYTTESEELTHCDHVYVFRNGAIVADLARRDLTEEKVIHSSFGEADMRAASPALLVRDLLPALSLILVSGAIAWLNPRAISYLGFTLMLNLAVPIALATVSQMFVIAGNDLDLSLGSFVSFAACVGATWLVDSPPVGIAILAASVGIYAAPRRDHPVAQSAVHCGDPGHELRLAGTGASCPAKTWRCGAGLAADLDGFLPPLLPFPVVAALVIAALVCLG